MSLSERILSHVNASQLHRSTNVVLQEEFSTLDEAVGDILAIFANVEEVRDAVHQLEQKLHNKLKGRTSGIKVVAVEVKEEEKNEDENVNKHKKQKVVEEPKRSELTEFATTGDKKKSWALTPRSRDSELSFEHDDCQSKD
ncbi:hypothetical protein F441_05265 [Phytophthora nicotianae CJ01A1]|uniref:Uncharacterized protein n=1 Tax=Phytophthora nicotianae CJ01A1 TaxID=1317063 RepID=W2XFG7_PHYNI|nr:hypothetical protein F441_05265 [Phytophthora nicotianae CJ01A1]